MQAIADDVASLGSSHRSHNSLRGARVGNSSAQLVFYEPRITRFLTRHFPLFEILLTWKEENFHMITIVGSVWMALQHLAFLINPHYKYISQSNAWMYTLSRVVYGTQLSFYDPIMVSSSTVIVYIILSYSLFALVCGLYILIFMIRFHKPEEKGTERLYSVVPARLLLDALSTVLCVPILQFCFAGIVCGRSGDMWQLSENTGSGNYVNGKLTDGSAGSSWDVSCWGGNHIAVFVPSLLVAIMILPLQYVTTACMYNYKPDINNFLSQRHSIVNICIYFHRLFACFLFNFMIGLDVPIWFVLIHAVTSAVLVLMYIYFLPYYSISSNRAFAVLYSIECVVSVIAATQISGQDSLHVRYPVLLCFVGFGAVLLVLVAMLADVRVNSNYYAAMRMVSCCSAAQKRALSASSGAGLDDAGDVHSRNGLFDYAETDYVYRGTGGDGTDVDSNSSSKKNNNSDSNLTARKYGLTFRATAEEDVTLLEGVSSPRRRALRKGKRHRSTDENNFSTNDIDVLGIGSMDDRDRAGYEDDAESDMVDRESKSDMTELDINDEQVDRLPFPHELRVTREFSRFPELTKQITSSIAQQKIHDIMADDYTAQRRGTQAVLEPYVNHIHLPSDACLAAGFVDLFVCQFGLEQLSPLMIVFGAHIYTRAMIVFPYDSWVMQTFATYIVNYIPGLSFMAVDLIKQTLYSEQCTLDQKFRVLKQSEELRQVLGIRTYAHNLRCSKAQAAHAKVLQSLHRFWAKFIEPSVNIREVSEVADEVNTRRETAIQCYDAALRNMQHMDHNLIHRLGDFFNEVFMAPEAAQECYTESQEMHQAYQARAMRGTRKNTTEGDIDELRERVLRMLNFHKRGGSLEEKYSSGKIWFYAVVVTFFFIVLLACNVSFLILVNQISDDIGTFLQTLYTCVRLGGGANQLSSITAVVTLINDTATRQQMRALLYSNALEFSIALQFLISQSSLTKTDKSSEYLMSPSIPAYFTSINNTRALSVVELSEKSLEESIRLVGQWATPSTAAHDAPLPTEGGENVINEVQNKTHFTLDDDTEQRAEHVDAPSNNIAASEDENEIILKSGALLSSAYSNLLSIIKKEDQQQFILRCVSTFIPLFVVNMVAVCVTLVTVLLGFRLTTLRRVFTFQLFTLIPFESVEKLAIETKAQFRLMRQEKAFKPRSRQAEDQPMTRSRSIQYIQSGGGGDGGARSSSPKESTLTSSSSASKKTVTMAPTGSSAAAAAMASASRTHSATVGDRADAELVAVTGVVEEQPWQPSNSNNSNNNTSSVHINESGGTATESGGSVNAGSGHFGTGAHRSASSTKSKAKQSLARSSNSLSPPPLVSCMKKSHKSSAGDLVAGGGRTTNKRVTFNMVVDIVGGEDDVDKDGSGGGAGGVAGGGSAAASAAAAEAVEQARRQRLLALRARRRAQASIAKGNTVSDKKAAAAWSMIFVVFVAVCVFLLVTLCIMYYDHFSLMSEIVEESVTLHRTVLTANDDMNTMYRNVFEFIASGSAARFDDAYVCMSRLFNSLPSLSIKIVSTEAVSLLMELQRNALRITNANLDACVLAASLKRNSGSGVTSVTSYGEMDMWQKYTSQEVLAIMSQKYPAAAQTALFIQSIFPSQDLVLLTAYTIVSTVAMPAGVELREGVNRVIAVTGRDANTKLDMHATSLLIAVIISGCAAGVSILMGIRPLYRHVALVLPRARVLLVSVSYLPVFVMCLYMQHRANQAQQTFYTFSTDVRSLYNFITPFFTKADYSSAFVITLEQLLWYNYADMGDVFASPSTFSSIFIDRYLTTETEAFYREMGVGCRRLQRFMNVTSALAIHASRNSVAYEAAIVEASANTVWDVTLQSDYIGIELDGSGGLFYSNNVADFAKTNATQYQIALDVLTQGEYRLNMMKVVRCVSAINDVLLQSMHSVVTSVMEQQIVLNWITMALCLVPFANAMWLLYTSSSYMINTLFISSSVTDGPGGGGGGKDPHEPQRNGEAFNARYHRTLRLVQYSLGLVALMSCAIFAVGMMLNFTVSGFTIVVENYTSIFKTAMSSSGEMSLLTIPYRTMTSTRQLLPLTAQLMTNMMQLAQHDSEYTVASGLKLSSVINEIIYGNISSSAALRVAISYLQTNCSQYCTGYSFPLPLLNETSNATGMLLSGPTAQMIMTFVISTLRFITAIELMTSQALASLLPIIESTLSQSVELIQSLVAIDAITIEAMSENCDFTVRVVMLLVAAVIAVTVLIYMFIIAPIIMRHFRDEKASRLLLQTIPPDIRDNVPVIAHHIETGEFSNANELQVKFAANEKLLQNILPPKIAARLKGGELPIADTHDCVTMLFTDFVGFTKRSSTMVAREIVEFLNEVFLEFDTVVELLSLEKIKTIGDAFFMAGGLDDSVQDHGLRMVEAGLMFFDALDEHNRRHPTRAALQMRLGIHTGPVVAGVIGIKKVAYDLWGDAIEVANAMESTGVPGYVHISEDTARLVRGFFELTPRGPLPREKEHIPEVMPKTYLVTGRLLPTPYMNLRRPKLRTSSLLDGGI